ncbi:MAG TPA: PEP-CTERM sorting domain-containing protein [Phycisphaerae bacterium]|nr:PEP-CTERM sorting domain-containing protein [Phycisphaerae bacterium]
MAIGRSRVIVGGVCFLGILLWLSAGALSGAPLTIWDLNSSVTVDPNTDDGMYGWLVDGTGHLTKQWFWYRIGPDGPETPINELGDLEVKFTDVNQDPNVETVALRYYNDDVEVQMKFTLTGSTAGSGRADINESVSIKNLTDANMDFHFFQYCDFDLNGTSDDANVAVTGGNTARQNDEGLVWASETVTTPQPDHHEVDFFADTLSSLNDGNTTTLSDAAGPIGPGNLTWAFQWDFTIGAGDSVPIGKDKMIVPEPAVGGLLGAGAALLVVRRRRRARRRSRG